jgi:hypothetical protein
MRAQIQKADPHRLAARTGAIYQAQAAGQGRFQLAWWGRMIEVDFPAFTARDHESGVDLHTFDLTMLAYYFDLSDGTPMSGEWLAFNQLPDGMFYAQAFQGYTGNELLKAFGNDADAFLEANQALDGRREFFGNLAFSYQVLPRVRIMVVCWLGDEDFPASYRILFDAAASHHLTTDGCAILGSQLVRRLIKNKPAGTSAESQ